MIESSSIKLSGSGTSDGATAVSDIPSKQTSQTQTQTISKKDEERQSPPINNDHHIIESSIADHLPIANLSQTSPQTTDQQQNGYHHHPTTISDEEKKNILAILHSGTIALEDYDPREQLKQLHIRNQSEIISKIPGINLFIRPFEELTTSKNEKMLGDLECRVMNRLDDIVNRLDGIDVRLDAIEQCLKGSDDNIGQQILTSTDDDTSSG